ncbi:hypothetical protein N0V94_003153 [Neodidymelliopsis sp. IMI 364377]|nr:hypothetical protein N0V94_003153 [Neodidymelliopsis sp. IMI 364377]
MPSISGDYINIGDGKSGGRERTPWYWRFIALAASWMILGGYLILPGLYAKEPQLRFSQAVLSVFVVALLTAGYSFTALLCFACHDREFQIESVYLYALASSVFGVLTIIYNFFATRSYHWGTAAVSGTVISTTATILYAALFLWTHRRVAKLRKSTSQRSGLYSEQSFYTNYIQNQYPSAIRTTSQGPEVPLNEDDRVNQQMAMLLIQRGDARPSPDANSSTYRIDLPEDREEQAMRERHARSQELVGTPQPSHMAWNRDRADSRADSLSENQAWQQLQERGRTQHRLSDNDLRGNHSRGLSREERRREIELGHA